MEIGPRRCFPTAEKGNAPVGFPGERDSDILHGSCHYEYVVICLARKVYIGKENVWGNRYERVSHALIFLLNFCV